MNNQIITQTGHKVNWEGLPSCRICKSDKVFMNLEVNIYGCEECTFTWRIRRC